MKKIFRDISVFDASRTRISLIFDLFEKIYVSFSGGKDSTVMLHLVMEEAIARNRKVGVLIIDLEAQYKETIKHLEETVKHYEKYIDLHWVCAPLLMRNAVTNFEPRWICWDESKKDIWVREKPQLAKSLETYDFFVPEMEFEEFMVLFGIWYGKGEPTAAFVGIRSDESLHRYCAVSSDLNYENKVLGKAWTHETAPNLYNIYPIYDWKTQDIWVYHGKFPNKIYNKIYDKMHMAGVKLSQQRICQPYGDDQKKGLWLYHILEPDTWFKLVARVNGANSGALYIQETGNMTGYNKVTKPKEHSWKSFCNLLLQTMPKKTRDHYTERFKKFIIGWRRRGYSFIPDESPPELESACWAPSWRRLCKTLLRNDYWCKGLGMTQPKSEAYGKFLALRKDKKLRKDIRDE